MAERTTSKKHDEFVRERMEDKAATELAGIGEKGGEQLAALGFATAKQVLGQFLVMGEDPDVFGDWLQQNVSKLNSKHRGDLIFCLQEWIKRNL
ncbi:hypothetical protein PTSG_03374 [Salpingoeca rosetta]|uniref:Barrier-to-autointegration factor n=1 Tax=Salpingoeca rosetta (strain ATCC 50818 / BSB-021) TaxID=946362 RepID=F2U507_SALR5|nr:uncharacterized protein PTSG_03374 [Salpingoeca rosetta]EGD82723.1 hypothetical protein PTSG_03374 [Salpingoeca rosetta]|eukprot:XP_004995959.1 hypothetical protein PTSG_03374 [Salpingoeca rosetta]